MSYIMSQVFLKEFLNEIMIKQAYVISFTKGLMLVKAES
jgi:hypothetical protein